LVLAITLIAFLLGGLFAGTVCNILLLRFSQSLGIRNKNDVTIRWSNESKPSLGGVSFFVAFLFGAMAHAVVFDENIFHNPQFIGLVVAGIMAFAMGLSDDAYNTRPWIKLSVQIGCGVILVVSRTVINLTGMDYQAAPVDYFCAGHLINSAITIIWVVGVMNSLNMLDNMDGITGTTVLFILISCLAGEVILFDWNMNIWTLTLLVQIGAILGFLRFNIHPSKLFMGDAGSQFIGLFTAFFAIHHLWNIGGQTSLSPWTGFFVTLIAFTPAAADTLTVVINRLKKGQSPMVGGKDHTTHHLVYSGLNDRQVWYVFVVISVLSSLIAVLSITFAKWGNPWMAAFLTLYFVIVFFLLYRNTVIHRHRK
jgi:UDP-GlcNAc:undecaprenyl-phosphate/decaprenyl-phosphate GlcNAc-1-phosphate transferase